MDIAKTAGPFIKKFNNDGFFYIYDVNTNQVVEVGKIVYDIIDDYSENDVEIIFEKYSNRYSRLEIKESLEKIKKARDQNGLFSDFKPAKVCMGARHPEPIKRLYEEHGLEQLLLELTKSCNVKCSYCNVSGEYANPWENQYHMTEETCRKTIDYFCIRANKSKKPVITFYGGEPLLKFTLMKKTVEYVTRKYGSDKYSYNITTNGTILNKEIADFFIKHDFELLVSLDGPEKVNDRYRATRDGKGTFQKIIKNLIFLKTYNPGYFAGNVSISSVLAPPFNDIDNTLAFFLTNNIFKTDNKRIPNNASFVDEVGTTFFKDYGLDDAFEECMELTLKFNECLKTFILEKDLTQMTMERNAFYAIIKNLALRKTRKLYKDCYPQGACHIGMRRLFVKTNGDFYVCERSGNNYKIGCIDTGIDYDVIADYYRKQEEALAGCVNCWSIVHCERCWAAIGDLSKFHGKKKENFCRSQKATIETALKGYTELLRKKPDCLKVFRENE